nr:hypothetical protein [Myxococcota bacterium]
MEVKHRKRLGPDLVAATIAFALPGIVCALWLAPRAAIPTEMPSLALPADDVRAAIDREHALAASAPDDERATRRRELSDEQNVAELRGGDRES